MATFTDFDSRGYRMVDARTGYGEWVTTYEGTVEDAMDIALLERLSTPRWETVREAADLGCGTGRTGAWLRQRGVVAIDGVDLTPEMLDRARARGAHRTLAEADVASSGLATGAYDLAITSLVDEHLATLDPLYREAYRVVRPGGQYVLVAYHPQFMMVTGMPTHFKNAAGEEIAITTHLHLVSDHVTAALGAGWTLMEMQERLIDDDWVALKPKWARYRNHPISAAYVWQK
jgi:SAM-dependent methyltransferase